MRQPALVSVLTLALLLAARIAAAAPAAPAGAAPADAPVELPHVWESSAGLQLDYGESPDGTARAGRLGLWVFAHGGASFIGFDRIAHPRLGDLTALAWDMTVLVPLRVPLPTGGLGVLIGTAGSGQRLVVGLYPTLGIAMTPFRNVVVSLNTRYYFLSTGRATDLPVVSLDLVGLW